MISRVLLLFLTLFWVTMNILLWRAEYGSRPGFGSRLPARLVWEKILTSPDSSSLTIFHKGKRIGFCHWVTSVGDDLSRLSATESVPEGMVGKIANYRVGLDGNVALDDTAERLRFDSHLSLDAHQQWQSFDLRLNLRPSNWEIHSSASTRTVRINWEEESGKFERVLKFSDFEHPEILAEQFGGPVLAGVLGGLGLPSGADRKRLGGLGLEWEARNESIRLGHSSVRAYRLQARLLDRYSMVIFVSRAGEFLRVELPDGITMANDQLGGN
jgi:hypothetical protein